MSSPTKKLTSGLRAFVPATTTSSLRAFVASCLRKPRASRPERARIPGLALLLMLLATGVTWTAAARLSRPVLMTADDVPQFEHPGLDGAWPELRVDLNRADAAELTLLPGIGPGLAERIVSNRAAHGPFQSIEDLMRVKRIGPAIIDRLRPYATVE